MDHELTSKHLDQLKEEIIMHYKLSYDLDIAMMKCQVDKETQKVLKKDKDFMFRINYEDALLQENIVSTLRHSMNSEDDKLAHRAAIDLGNLYYKKRFREKDDDTRAAIPSTIILKGRAPGDKDDG